MTECLPDDPTPDPVDEALHLLAVAVRDLDEQLPRALEAGQSAARLLADLDPLIERARGVRSILERELTRDRKHSTVPYEVDGVLFRVSGGNKREWTDHREVAWRIAEGALADPETGECLEEKDAWRIVDRMLTALPSSPYWRVTGLRELEVDFSDLQTFKPGRRTVALVAPEVAK